MCTCRSLSWRVCKAQDTSQKLVAKLPGFAGSTQHSQLCEALPPPRYQPSPTLNSSHPSNHRFWARAAQDSRNCGRFLGYKTTAADHKCWQSWVSRPSGSGASQLVSHLKKRKHQRINVCRKCLKSSSFTTSMKPPVVGNSQNQFWKLRTSYLPL